MVVAATRSVDMTFLALEVGFELGTIDGALPYAWSGAMFNPALEKRKSTTLSS